jgi:dolichol-phosphate mannosyltransferase
MHESTAPSARPRLGVVTPLANEIHTIDELLDRVLAQLGPNDRYFCVLDNVSKDGTKARIEERAQSEPRLMLVWAPQNRCVVDAYVAGYRAALAANCQWILEMDGGLSHLPEQIPEYIQRMQEGYDFVAGSRFMPGGAHRGGLLRYLISKGGTVLSNLVLGTRMRDMCSGFECFTHEALSYIVRNGVKSRANFFQTEIRYMLHDWNWIELPITYSNPSPSVGKAQIMDSLHNLRELRRRGRPPRSVKHAAPGLIHP